MATENNNDVPTDEQIVNAIMLCFLDRMQTCSSVDDALKAAEMLMSVRHITRAPITMVFDDGAGQREDGDT